MRELLNLVSIFMPWILRRWMLQAFFGYEIAPTARIGFSWVLPEKLVMDANSAIDDFTMMRGLQLAHLKESAFIGRGNWITGLPLSSKIHFQHLPNRKPQLIVGEHAAITSRHIVDCTDSVTIGRFSIVGGFRSQLLTHSIDFRESRQSCAPIIVGEFSFVGTNCVLLGGSKLPDFSILAAQAVLNCTFDEPYRLYAGVPAQPAKELDHDYKFFSRNEGFVV